MGNLFEAIERLLLRHARQMREAARQVNEALQLDAAPAGSPSDMGSVTLRTPKRKSWQRQSDERRAARLAHYEEAVRRRAQGASISRFAMKVNGAWQEGEVVEKQAARRAYEDFLHRKQDPALLELVESGKIALPFEMILRLASVLGRHDPVSFVLRFTRSYNPDAWRTLESLGIGRLAVQAGREREFANIYRASDAARRLSDEEFGELLKFVQAAFSMALAWHATERSRTHKA